VGNTIFPLLKEYPQLTVYGIDCSKRAVDIIRKCPEFVEAGARSAVEVCDICNDDFPTEFSSLNFATLIFCLSAVQPSDMVSVLKKCWQCLNSGGLLYIRDYAMYDMTQLRFKNGSKLSADEPLYMRADGTRTYFFTLEKIRELLEQSGFVVVQADYCQKEVENIKRQIVMRRCWIQIKARKH